MNLHETPCTQLQLNSVITLSSSCCGFLYAQLEHTDTVWHVKPIMKQIALQCREGAEALAALILIAAIAAHKRSAEVCNART